PLQLPMMKLINFRMFKKNILRVGPGNMMMGFGRILDLLWKKQENWILIILKPYIIILRMLTNPVTPISSILVLPEAVKKLLFIPLYPDRTKRELYLIQTMSEPEPKYREI